MEITKKEKERFVDMLYKHQIIIIQCNKGSNRKTYDYKFIGADVRGRYDFTRLCAELSGYPNNGGCEYLSIRALDGVAVLTDTLEKIKPIRKNETVYNRYSEVRDLVCTFYV